MERRRNRSPIIGEALNLLLKSSANRLQVKDLVLSDEHGLLVASNRNGESSEALAVAGRLLADGLYEFEKTTFSALGVHSFQSQKQSLYLSWNAIPSLSTAKLAEAETSVKRILARRPVA